MKNVYICSDTITGLFSGIYDAWKSGKDESECGISFKGMVETELFCDYKEVEEHEKKAIAVEKLIHKNLGQWAYWSIYHAALSHDKNKGNAILGTMLAAKKIKNSARIMEHLSHPQVEKVFELSRQVGGEAHAMKGFLRFQELENGVLYAKITPKAQVLTCIAPHFADRLPLENWMIHDVTHNMFVVHEAKKKWVLLWDENLNLEEKLKLSKNELEYEKLWNGFCQTIAIESRTNPKCQMQHLPLRFRPDMVEFGGGVQG